MVSILQFSCLKTNCQDFYLSWSDLTHSGLSSNLCSSSHPPPCARRKVLTRWLCWLKPSSHQFCYKLGEVKQRMFDTSWLHKTCFFLSLSLLNDLAWWGPEVPNKGEAEIQSWITKWCHQEPIGTVGISCLAATSNAHHTRVRASDPLPAPMPPVSSRLFQRTEAEQLLSQAEQFMELPSFFFFLTSLLEYNCFTVVC